MLSSLDRCRSDVAVICESGEVLTYMELDARVNAFCDRLTAGRGLLLLECTNSLNTIVSYLAALRTHSPVSLVDSGRQDDIKRLKRNFSFLYHYSSVKDALSIGHIHQGLDIHPDLAVLLSTSGSTGTAKCARLSIENINANAKSIVEYLGITSADRAPTNLPMYYSYGLSIINSHLSAGACLFVTERSVIEPEFWDFFDIHRCTSFAGVPHTYDLIEKSEFRTADRPFLRYATQAGGKMDPDLVTELGRRSTAEGWQFFVMYGQTEAAPRMAYLPPRQTLINPHCIGLPIPGGTFRLETDDGQEILQSEETGELVYRGPNVMMGYATNDADLALGDNQDELQTGDLARRTKDGFYYIVGRKSRFIKPFGLRVSLDAVEGWLAEHGIKSVSAGQAEDLWVLTTDEIELASLETSIANWLGIPTSAVHVRNIDEIPCKPNGKTDFPAIAALVREMAADDDQTSSTTDGKTSDAAAWFRAPFQRSNTQRSVMDVFQEHFPGADIRREDSFSCLGGDSLSYVAVMLDLEAVIGELPERWEGQSIHSLGEQSIESTAFSKLDMQTLLRFLSITLIVCGHFQVVDYGGGGAYLLLMIAGFNFAAFQMDTIAKSGSIKPILVLAAKISVPTIAYLLLLAMVFDSFDISVIFLVSNFFEPDANGGFSAWFIEVYIQIMLVVAILASIRVLREPFSQKPFMAAVIFAILATLLFVVSHAVWDTHYLFRRLPHMLLWLFAIGMAAHIAITILEKVVVTGVLMTALLLFSTGNILTTFLTYGALALIWAPYLRVPRWAKRTITEIAGASLFIYLTHFQFKSAVSKLVDGSPILFVVGALIGGTLLWIAYSTLLKWLAAVWWRAATPART